ncbi:DeoR/GlpR family DNA-binding transcription regulator [Shinella sp.]|uniref:DeoR/GlpR family DNA-binding transcription regulator n=1 Tax=Shinella sp. TaxID=1870904 RepID=UPI003F6FA038
MIKRLELIPAQRRGLVLEHIQKHGAISIQQLVETIAVSSSTIRRDLEELEAEGYIERTRGGALIQRTRKSTFEPKTTVAAEFAREEKRAIAARAAEMLEAGNSVIFDSSTTVREVARLVAKKNLTLTAITNDLSIGEILGAASATTVVIPGGTLRSGSVTLRGEPGHAFWRTIHVDIAFLGTHAISDGRLSETSLDVAAQKRMMIEAAERVVLVADSSKFQPAAFCQICSLDMLDEMITDENISPDNAQMVRDAGIDLIIVPLAAEPN